MTQFEVGDYIHFLRDDVVVFITKKKFRSDFGHYMYDAVTINPSTSPNFLKEFCFYDLSIPDFIAVKVKPIFITE
jgi:hypothetical protein